MRIWWIAVLLFATAVALVAEPARGAACTSLTRLALCPYPQVARYMGTGSIDDDANFTCAAP